MNTVLMIIVGVVLTLGTGIFVAAEFSFIALDPATVRRRVAEGDKRAAGVIPAIEHLSTQLSGAQIGITLTTILLGYTTQTALTTYFSTLFHSTALASTVATTLAVILALVIVNAYSMLFGELVPKNLALAAPLKIAGLVAPFQKSFTWLFKPVVYTMNTVANKIVTAFGVEPMEEISSARSASELAAMVRHSAEEGALDVNTAQLFTKSVGMGQLTAVDAMRDRGRMETIVASASAQDLVNLARDTGHSRFPVIDADADDIVGVAHLRRAIGVPFDKRDAVPVTSSSIMTDIPKVPETVSLAPLLVDLRDQGTQMAIVVDEYGGTSGLITLEDVVEEIVGEIADEHDPRRRGVRAAEDGTWQLSGLLRPDEVGELTGVYLPEDGPFETLAGLMLSDLGRMPTVGDTIDVNGNTLKVVAMDGRRISQVLLIPAEEDGEDQ